MRCADANFRARRPFRQIFDIGQRHTIYHKRQGSKTLAFLIEWHANKSRFNLQNSSQLLRRLNKKRLASQTGKFGGEARRAASVCLRSVMSEITARPKGPPVSSSTKEARRWTHTAEPSLRRYRFSSV